MMDADPFANGNNPFAAIGYDDGGGTGSAPSAPSHADPFANGNNPFLAIGFDDGSGQPAAAAAPVSPHPGALANAPDDSTAAGAAKGGAPAAIKGVGDAIGFAGNLHGALDYGENWIESKFTGETPEQVGARRQAAFQKAQQQARDAGGLSGVLSTGAQTLRPGDVSGSTISDPILSKTGEYVPTSEAGRLGMAAVEAGVGSVGPGMGAARGAEAVKTIVPALPAMAASGAAAQGTTDATGSPIAGMVAGFGAPIVGEAALRFGAAGARSVTPPVTAAQREAYARGEIAKEMQSRATDPQAAASSLIDNPDQLLPGSVGTTAQISGDPGLVRWEKGIRNTPAGGAALEGRAIDQNNARQAYLGTLQPSGSALDLSAGLRDQQAATDAATRANIADVDASTSAQRQLADTVTQGHVAAAQKASQDAIAGMRSLIPDASPADFASHLRQVRDALDQEADAHLSTASQAASSARAATAPSGQSVADVGAAMRRSSLEAADASKAQVSDLWRAVDPTGKMVMPSASIAAAAKDIKAEVTPSATQMGSDEARIFDAASNYEGQTPFREVTKLRSSLSTAMSQARLNGDAQALRRLTMLRGSVEDAIDHAVENQASLDQIAVRRGAMTPEDSIDARARALSEKWADDLAAIQPNASGHLARTGTGPSEFSGSGSPSRPGSFGTTRSPEGRVGQAPSDPGISSPPPLDAEAAGRLKAASAATREHAETFKQGAAGAILREGGRKGEFAVSDAKVPGTVFKPGPTGGEAVRSYMAAGGSHEALFDAAAMSAREASIQPDATYDGAAISQWMARHREALAAMPQEVSDRFLTSIDAHQAVEDAIANRRDAMSAFEKSEAGKAAKLSQPADIVSHVGAILNSNTGAVQRMSELAKASRGNQAASDGLKRAVVENIIDRFVPAVGDPRADKLDAFLSAKGDVLSKVLQPADIDKLKAQSAEMQARAAAAGKAELSRDTVMHAMDLSRRDAMKAAEADRAQKMSDFQRGVVAQLIGTRNRDDVLNILKGIVQSTNGASRMESLAKRAENISGGPDALRRGMQEMIQRDVNSTTASGATDVMEQQRAVFAKLMAEKRDVLQAAGLSPMQMNKLDLIVKDGMQANRSISLAKARGGSDTDANKQLRLEGAGNRSIINRLAHEAAGLALGGAVGYLAGGPLGSGVGAAAGWLGRTTVAHLREAGLSRVREMRIEAALHPELGLSLLQQAPKGSYQSAAVAVGLRARQLAVLQAEDQGRPQR